MHYWERISPTWPPSFDARCVCMLKLVHFSLKRGRPGKARTFVPKKRKAMRNLPINYSIRFCRVLSPLPPLDFSKKAMDLDEKAMDSPSYLATKVGHCL